jgi:hypothetical protein
MWIRSLFARLGSRRRVSHHARRQLQLAVERLEDRLQPSATSAIAANFNRIAIPAGDSIWFNSVAQVNGLGSKPVNVQVLNASVDFTANGKSYDVPVPNAAITFSPTANVATTTFDAKSNTWITVAPMNPRGDVFLAGAALPLPAGLPGGIKQVTWTATFQSNTAGISLDWQWAAAAYSTFSSNYQSLNVKPLDSNKLTVYANGDNAGTPEAFGAFVVSGARGHGNGNFTGRDTAAQRVTPAVLVSQPPSSLSGVVTDTSKNPVSGVTVNLTGSDSSGKAVNLSATTDANGAYSFGNLQPGTYTITVVPPFAWMTASESVGTLGGSMGQDQITGISFSTGGQNGTGYNFMESPPAS